MAASVKLTGVSGVLGPDVGGGAGGGEDIGAEAEPLSPPHPAKRAAIDMRIQRWITSPLGFFRVT